MFLAFIGAFLKKNEDQVVLIASAILNGGVAVLWRRCNGGEFTAFKVDDGGDKWRLEMPLNWGMIIGVLSERSSFIILRAVNK